MLDQSFTAYHFNEVFQIERRKGNIRKDFLPGSYLAVLEDGHRIDDEIRELKRVKRKEWTPEQKERFDELKEEFKVNLKLRRQEESKWFEALAEKINRKGFKIKLNKIELGDKDGFTLTDTPENFFVMKTLQYNLKKVFKVQQANRHRIMTQVRILMNESTPKYIIRTDVHHFYESIPQDKLLNMIKGNTLLSKMSVRFIWQILEEYERLKDVEEPEGLGVPRGVGVSAYLSEIYLRDLDERIKRRPEVVYYVRYVDDIFMILSHLPVGVSIEAYYDDIRKEFEELGLKLMDPDDEDQKEKLQLLDLYTFLSKGDKDQSGKFSYLGYQLEWLRHYVEAGNQSGSELITKFNISENKKTKIRKRIDAAFKHFEEKTKYSLSEARKDLRDSLRFIAGNYRLTKSKAGVKAGIYYNNDLLTEVQVLNGFTKHLRKKDIKVYPTVFKDKASKERYIEGIKRMVKRFNFQKNWEKQKSYSISDKRIKEISRWLSEE